MPQLPGVKHRPEPQDDEDSQNGSNYVQHLQSKFVISNVTGRTILFCFVIIVLK